MRELTTYTVDAFIFVLIILQLVYYRRLGEHTGIITAALGVSLLTEIAGMVYLKMGFTNNHVVYNVGSLFIFLFIFLYYYKVMNNRKLKKAQLWLILIFLISYALFAFLVDDFLTKFQVKTYFVHVLLLLSSICIFFYETFNSEKVLRIKKYYSFWISIGFVIIYFGLLPVLLLGTSSNHYLSIKLFFMMIMVVNIIGYSVLLTGIFYSNERLAVE